MNNNLTVAMLKLAQLKSTILSLIFVLYSITAFSAPFRLFSRGQQVENYNEIIKILIANKKPFSEKTFLLFDDDPPIEITRFLGRGGQTAVFKRADGRALRVPLSSGNVFFRNGPGGTLKDNGPYTNGMISFLSAMRKVQEISAVAPKIFESDSHSPEYITVEYFDAKFNILDFFSRRDELLNKGLITANDMASLEQALVRFIKRMAPFQYIGDFKVEQLMCNGKNWRLLDNSDPVKFATSVDAATPFDHRNMGPRLPSDVYDWINQIIRNERQSNPAILIRKQMCEKVFQ